MKRIFSLALTMLFVLVMFALPASVSADTSTALIDTTQTGTLNIYKYEMDDVSVADYPGTGTTADASHVPASAKPYAGVTFTIKKVAGISPTYFTKDGVTLPTPAAAASMTVLSTSTAVTNSSGFASFSGLDLGIYLVQETNAPSQTTGRVADFVVSLPRTNTSGDGWDYTVTVYPKNETSYSEITISKTDYKTSAPLQNAVFKLQKYNGTSWVDVESGLTTSASGTVVPTDKLNYNTLYRIEETSAPSGYILDYANRYTEFYINSDGNVSDPTTHNVINTSNPKLISVTNSKPAISKYIINKDSNQTTFTASDLITETTYKSSSRYYTIKVETPNVDIASLSELKVTDVVGSYSGPAPSVSKVSTASGTEVASSEYTSSFASGTNTLTVTLNTSNGTAIQPNTTYYITVFMIENIALGATKTNTATLSYNTNTNDSTAKNTITSNQTRVYRGGFQGKKVDPSDNALTGVQFKLYKTLADAKADTNAYATATSDASGYFTFDAVYYGTNIDSGSMTYYLVETQTLSGYNLMSDPLAVTVNKNSHLYSNTSCKIVNSRKTNLPLTGGYGAVALYGIGIVLILSGATTLIVRTVKRKKSAKD